MKNLIEIKGVPAKLQNNFKKLGDLLYENAPLFSHLINERNEDYLIKWCDKDDRSNRWMLFKTDCQLLLDFFEIKINFADLINNTPEGFIYFIETGKNAKWENITASPIKDIPEEYLPSQNVFYKKRAYEPYAQQLHIKLKQYFAKKHKNYSLPVPEQMVVSEPKPSGYGKNK